MLLCLGMAAGIIHCTLGLVYRHSQVVCCLALFAAYRARLVLIRFINSPFVFRIYVVYVTDELGGQKAADLIKERVMKISAFRRVSPPVKVTALLQQAHIPGQLLQSSIKARQVPSCSVVVASAFRGFRIRCRSREDLLPRSGAHRERIC